jgi:hypothetical protein
MFRPLNGEKSFADTVGQGAKLIVVLQTVITSRITETVTL